MSLYFHWCYLALAEENPKGLTKDVGDDGLRRIRITPCKFIKIIPQIQYSYQHRNSLLRNKDLFNSSNVGAKIGKKTFP
jgi:hypothetical protein